MKRKGVLCWLAVALILVMAMALANCSDGSDGSSGLSAYEIAVNNGFTGTEQEWLASLGSDSGFETCALCHEYAGEDHQDSYDELYQAGVITLGNPAYAYSAAITSDIVTFTMSDDCTLVENLNIYFAPYTGSGFELAAGRLSIKGTLSYAAGECTSTNAASALGDLTAQNGLLVVYGRDDTIGSIPGTRVQMAKFPYAAVAKLGTVDYTSASNNAGCEKCHTVPFLKHGYILGETGAGTDMYVCKACHLDDGDGGHFIWQLLVDDAELIIELETEFGAGWEDEGDDPRLAKYQYKTSLKNDVHMSHAQEFPYPQSMSNCATCHDGKLDMILTQANFTVETCQSCHPVTDANGLSIMDAPALFDVMPIGHATYINPVTYDEVTTCTGCHGDAGSQPFDSIHTGYDPVIYTDATDGSKFSSEITVAITDADFDADTLTITFSAIGSATHKGDVYAAADIVPTVLVGLYGRDTKDFLVGPHASDVDSDRNLEFQVGFSMYGTPNSHPRFAVADTSVPGTWIVEADLSHWADLIDDGTIWNAEIAVMPDLGVIVGLDDNSVAGSEESDDYSLALNAVSRTFDLDGNTFTAKVADIVSVDEGCNNCHDALATTFHGPDRGGSIEVCRLCHFTQSGGSHLEMQSRSIDSYIHAIHSFQPFDVGGSSRGVPRGPDFTDPVEELHYEHHIGFVYPTFGLTNCESCHNEGTYDVPNQVDSMPGLLSPANDTLTYGGWDRDIVPADFPAYVTGPAARACGACHKVGYINHDDVAGLSDLNQHLENYGYLWESDSDGVILDFIIDAVFSVYAP